MRLSIYYNNTFLPVSYIDNCDWPKFRYGIVVRQLLYSQAKLEWTP